MFQPDESWNEATPQKLPAPTYWPVIVALGLMFIFWGFVTTFIMSVTGFIIFSVGLGGWISELRNAIFSNNKTRSPHES